MEVLVSRSPGYPVVPGDALDSIAWFIPPLHVQQTRQATEGLTLGTRTLVSTDISSLEAVVVVDA